MDVDEQGKKKEDDYEEALNDPAVLQVRKIELIVWGVLSYVVSLVFFRRHTVRLINILSLIVRVCWRVCPGLIPSLRLFARWFAP